MHEENLDPAWRADPTRDCVASDGRAEERVRRNLKHAPKTMLASEFQDHGANDEAQA